MPDPNVIDTVRLFALIGLLDIGAQYAEEDKRGYRTFTKGPGS